MKALAIGILLIAISVQVGCSVTQSSPRTKTEWEIANEVVMDEFFGADSLTPTEALRRVYMNCVRFTEYIFQKEICHAASDIFSVDNAKTRALILVRVQIETNNPRPCGNAAQALIVGGQFG
jgi:hypothetical protein